MAWCADATARQVYANLPYEEMHAPVVGPAHPFQKDGIAAGMKNHRSGHVEVCEALIRLLYVALRACSCLGCPSTGTMARIWREKWMLACGICLRNPCREKAPQCPLLPA